MNEPPQEGRSKGCTHCGLVTFHNEKGRDEHLPHAAHQALIEKNLPIPDDVLEIDDTTRANPI